MVHRTLAMMLRSALQHLVDSDGDGNFQLLARDVLANRLNIRDVARMSVFQSDIQDLVDGFRQWQALVGQEEVDRQIAAARQAEFTDGSGTQDPASSEH